MDMANMNLSRRSFLISTAAAATAVALSSRAALGAEEKPMVIGEGPYGGLPLGVQSYTFRDRSFEKALDAIKNELHLDYVEIYPGHVVGKSPVEIKAMLEKFSLKPTAYGVVHFGNNIDKNRKLFEFAKEIGISSLTCDPSTDAFDNLDKLTEEYKITADIHDHGPGNHWAKIATIMDAIKDHSKMIGLCDDTGHFIRAGEDPLRAAMDVDGRLHGIHLKDFKKKLIGWEDCGLGDGSLKLADFIKYLISINYRGSLSIEYEGGKPDETTKEDLVRIKKIVDDLRAEEAKKK